MFLTLNFTFENKNGSIFCKTHFLSFTKMRVSEQDIVLRVCVREFPCLYDKGTLEYHQKDVTGNCWKEVANKTGLKNGEIPFVFFETLFLYHKMTSTIGKNKYYRQVINHLLSTDCICSLRKHPTSQLLWVGA